MNTYILFDLPYLIEPIFVITDDLIFIALIQEGYAPFVKISAKIEDMINKKSVYLKVIKSGELRQVSIYDHQEPLYVKPNKLSHILFLFISHNAKFNNNAYFMHGAVVVYGKYSIILTGKSGAGKSTLCSFLHLDHNHKIFCATDDKVLIDSNILQIFPCGDGIHLREDGVKIIESYFGNIREQNIELYDYKRAKIKISNIINSHLSAIVKIQRNDCMNDITELNTEDAVKVLLMNAFSSENIKNNIENALNLLRKIKVYKLRYTDLLKAKENIFNLIEEKII